MVLGSPLSVSRCVYCCGSYFVSISGSQLAGLSSVVWASCVLLFFFESAGWSIGGYSAAAAAALYPGLRGVLLDASFATILPMARVAMPPVFGMHCTTSDDGCLTHRFSMPILLHPISLSLVQAHKLSFFTFGWHWELITQSLWSKTY